MKYHVKWLVTLVKASSHSSPNAELVTWSVFWRLRWQLIAASWLTPDVGRGRVGVCMVIIKMWRQGCWGVIILFASNVTILVRNVLAMSLTVVFVMGLPIGSCLLVLVIARVVTLRCRTSRNACPVLPTVYRASAPWQANASHAATLHISSTIPAMQAVLHLTWQF